MKMEKKLNPKAVEQYAAEYADLAAREFFQKKEKISGQEILTLTPVRQVNLFVIHELMLSWKQEIEKIRSPFFNYESPEVKEAMQNFHNILSKHISLSSAHFIPLLKKAVLRTLVLILDPYTFYGKLIDRSEIPFDILQAELKYVKINQAPLSQLIEQLKARSVDRVSADTADKMLVTIFKESHFVPESPEVFEDDFSKTLAFHSLHFYEKQETPPPVLPKEPLPEKGTEEVVRERRSLADQISSKSGLLIRDRLTINQKFMFTKVLFHGDFEIFSKTIERLDSMDNLQQAKRFLNCDFPEWDTAGDEYLEFFDLVERRFDK